MFKSVLHLEVLKTSRTTFNVIIPGTLFFAMRNPRRLFYIRRLLHLKWWRGAFKTDNPDLLHSGELMQCIDENRCINQKVVEVETLNKIQWHYTNLNITTVQSILELPHILHIVDMLYSCDLLFRVFFCFYILLLCRSNILLIDCPVNYLSSVPVQFKSVQIRHEPFVCKSLFLESIKM